MKALRRLLGTCAPTRPVSPGTGRASNSFDRSLILRTSGIDILRDRNDESAPTFGAIDISLSLRITIRFFCCELAGVVEGLERHPAGHAAVADQRDRDAGLAAVLIGARDAERGRDRRAGVAGAEVVVVGLLAAQELPEMPVLLADAVEDRPPPREHLVRVALVPDVEHEAVDRRVEAGVDRA